MYNTQVTIIYDDCQLPKLMAWYESYWKCYNNMIGIAVKMLTREAKKLEQ